MWKGVVVLLSVLACAAAWQGIQMLEPKPEKFKDQEGCYIAELDKVIPFGKSAPSTKGCFEYRCGQANVVSSGCGSVSAHPPLKVIEEKDKPYPDCCKKIVH